MKKLFLISAIAMGGLFFNTANAQTRLSFGIHFGPARAYVPARVVVSEPAPVEYNATANYDGDDDYYYLPDVDAYYNVSEQCYYYMDGDQWVSAAYLPGAYRDYDWRSARRFEIRAARPFMHNDYYRNQYNGIAFNGRWNERNDRGYVSSYRENNNVNRDDNRRVDNDRRNEGYTRQVNQNYGRQDFDRNRERGGQQLNQDRGGHDRVNEQHFSANNSPKNDRGGRDNHRSDR